jgi:uncharacterized repeat protein (TIGR03803 family)
MLVPATNGGFYGTADFGGANDGGTVFRITSSGALATPYSFCAQSGCPDGDQPDSLVRATDGDFYGTTYGGGGDNLYGTIFKITPGGRLTTLYRFCSQAGCADGVNPYVQLLQDTNGDFYGTTGNGGEYCVTGGLCGTVFRLSVGLSPFVKTQTASGKVGAEVKVLGTNLTGATIVSFHGTAAAFTVVSPSLITATVPAGATSGIVEVETPSGTLKSNAPFEVLP